MEHASGVVSTLTTSFDADGAARHGVVVYGSEGTLLGGDPNRFDGPVLLRSREQPDGSCRCSPAGATTRRGLGLDDLCRAVLEGTPQRASGAQALHVLEVLMGMRASALEGGAVAIEEPGA